jgi:spermidine synthase
LPDAEWFTEEASEGHRLQWKVRRTLFRERSRYQMVEVVDTVQFGPALVLDGIMQTTTGDEFIYHEMLAYVPLNAHPRPERVLVIGGGDGGLVRDVLKCPDVSRVVMAEIDPVVVEAARRFLPRHATAFSDPRLSLLFRDGFQYVQEAAPESFDLILVDSTDPEGGPGQVLYSRAFHQAVARALAPNGIYVQHTGAPFYNPEVLEQVSHDVVTVFPLARVFWCAIPSYPGGLFTFLAASRGPDPATPGARITWPTRWYSPTVHRAAFSLPPFIAGLLPASMRPSDSPRA